MVRSIVGLTQIRNKLGLVGGKAYAPIRPTDTATDRGGDQRVEPTVDLFEQILAEAKSAVQSWGGKLYFVYLPAWHRYVPGEELNSDREAVLKVVEKLGLSLVDVHERFAAHENPTRLFPFGLQGHYNEEGNQLVAEYVLQSITLPSD